MPYLFKIEHKTFVWLHLNAFGTRLCLKLPNTFAVRCLDSDIVEEKADITGCLILFAILTIYVSLLLGGRSDHLSTWFLQLQGYSLYAEDTFKSLGKSMELCLLLVPISELGESLISHLGVCVHSPNRLFRPPPFVSKRTLLWLWVMNTFPVYPWVLLSNVVYINCFQPSDVIY